MSTVDGSTSARSFSRSKGAICYEHERDDETKRVRVPQDRHPYLEAIEVNEPDAREYADALPDLSLPGSGELYDDCGDEEPLLFCSDSGCGSVTEVGRTCRRSRCPRCWKSWAFHRSKTIASKLEAFRRYEYAGGNTDVKFHHVTISPPNSTRFDSKDPLGRAIELVKSLLQQATVSTGYIVYHPFRIATEHRGEVNGHESGDGDMTWKDVLPLIESEGFEAVREKYLTYAPHFHAVCVSDWVEGSVTDSIYEKTGVVMHRITKRDEPVSIGDLEDLCKVTTYGLSHAGLSQDEDGDTWRAAVRPFGEVANFTPTPTIEAEVDTKLREVAPTVLGIEFPKSRCSEQRLDEVSPTPSEDTDSPAGDVDRPAARVLTDSGATSGSAGDLGGSVDSGARNTGFADVGSGGSFDDVSTAWAAPESAIPPWLTEPDEPSDDRLSACGAPLVPMWKADEYLEDDEWMDSLSDESARALHEAHARWIGLGKPRPDTPPPD